MLDIYLDLNFSLGLNRLADRVFLVLTIEAILISIAFSTVSGPFGSISNQGQREVSNGRFCREAVPDSLTCSGLYFFFSRASP